MRLNLGIGADAIIGTFHVNPRFHTEVVWNLGLTQEVAVAGDAMVDMINEWRLQS